MQCKEIPRGKKKYNVLPDDFVVPSDQDEARYSFYKGKRWSLQEKEIPPFKFLFPNLVTILAICAGFSGIGSAIEGNYETAVCMVLVAAFLDGIDGRIARFMEATSKFGAQLDSLADVINFGVAPSLVTYIAVLRQAHAFGWSIALMYTIAISLRLARFNIMNDCDEKDNWKSEYFVGVPAPLGAILLMLPLYINFLGFKISVIYGYGSTIYAMIISFLLCSRLPVWSGKKIHRKFVLPIVLCSVAYIAFMIHFLWEMIIFSTLCYIMLLPISFYCWKKRYGIKPEQKKHKDYIK
ncbi:CDP-alcohol phosphatidyltransferase family protein [Candidatus Liberibacter asiaticus]|uniref:CDP-alcohol phosphatidyltransferase family protein n=1 Tax=Liberibacter asiaticus TaxID=34021 RepID=UPI001EE63CB6|nr:phosphatidylcholine/phosphatidylserine synthase [Candidatus Liberibacter asiaticus]MDI1493829.1 phosphatidylcholine/phosphatidylserine synthase [Candidatus Liberibacter asiaticus]